MRLLDWDGNLLHHILGRDFVDQLIEVLQQDGLVTW